MRNKISLWFGCLALLQLTTAHAYIGPGAGAGTIAIVLGILSSIFLAFLGLLWYPFKRLLRKFKAASGSAQAVKDSGSGSGV